MSAIHLIDPLLLWLPHAFGNDVSQSLLGQVSIAPDLHAGFQHSLDTVQTLLAQQFDTDPFRGTRTAFNNFVRTGQAWALLIGFVLGYIVRGLTTYG